MNSGIMIMKIMGLIMYYFLIFVSSAPSGSSALQNYWKEEKA
jgi:hypothetical protein